MTIWKPGDAYPAGSPRRPAGFAARLALRLQLRKWFVGKVNTNVWDSPLNFPVLRLAEMYLILAEAAGPTAGPRPSTRCAAALLALPSAGLGPRPERRQHAQFRMP